MEKEHNNFTSIENAIKKPRWILATFHTFDPAYFDLLLKDLYSNPTSIRTFYYQCYELEDEFQFRLFVKTDLQSFRQKKQSYIEDLKKKYFEHDNRLTFEEYHWNSFQGKSQMLCDNLLPLACQLIFNNKQNNTDWQSENAAKLGFELLQSIDLPESEWSIFYHFCFTERLKQIKSSENGEAIADMLLNEFSSNYDEEQNMAYFGEIVESIKNNNNSIWGYKCVALTQSQTYKNSKTIIPFELITTNTLENKQKRWPIYSHLLEQIYSSLRLSIFEELHLLFCIQKSLKSH